MNKKIIIGIILTLIMYPINTTITKSVMMDEKIIITPSINKMINVYKNLSDYLKLKYTVILNTNDSFIEPDRITIEPRSNDNFTIIIVSRNQFVIIPKKEGETNIIVTVYSNGSQISDVFQLNTISSIPDSRSSSSSSLYDAFDHIVFVIDSHESNETSKDNVYIPFLNLRYNGLSINRYGYDWFDVTSYKIVDNTNKTIGVIEIKIIPKKLPQEDNQTITGVFDVNEVVNGSNNRCVSRVVVLVKLKKPFKQTSVKPGSQTLTQNNTDRNNNNQMFFAISNGNLFIPFDQINFFTGTQVENDGSILKITSSNVFMSILYKNKNQTIQRVTYNKTYNVVNDSFQNCCLETEQIGTVGNVVKSINNKYYIQAKFLYEAFGGTVTWDRPTNTYKLMFYPGWQE